jgi:hypothetical protein
VRFVLPDSQHFLEDVLRKQLSEVWLLSENAAIDRDGTNNGSHFLLQYGVDQEGFLRFHTRIFFRDTQEDSRGCCTR